MNSQLVKIGRKTLPTLLITIFICTSLQINQIFTGNISDQSENHQNIPVLEREVSPSTPNDNPFQKVFEDLGINPQEEVIPSPEYDVLGKLRDNENSYQQVWTPWLSRAAVHVAKVSDDGEFLVVGGGYLLDTELHIYRWNSDERQYIKVWEAGSGIITRDIYDVAFGDSDNNNLIEIAAACADGRVYLFEQAHIYDPIANLENRFDFVWKSENYFQATSVEFYDLDLDGIQDLIVGAWDKRIHIFEYTDHSGYPFDVEHWIELTERWNSTEVDEKIQSLGVGDFNNNGLPDIIVGTLSGSIYIFENDGVVMAPHGIEFPFPNDNNYRLIWNNSGLYQPIWNPIGQIAIGELDKVDLSDAVVQHPTDAVVLAYGQGAWALRYSAERDFYLEQLIQDFEDWQTQGAYPFDNFADWMVREAGMNWQVYTQHINGSRYPEPWDGKTQNALDIFSNSAVTGAPLSNHGGVVYDEHEYLLITEAKNWEDAKVDCEARGGHLVTITSAGENAFIHSLAGPRYVWLGFSDAQQEGNWNQWITGESCVVGVDYTNWNTYEPNNLGGYENYGHMRYQDGKWNDIYNTNFAYVCEWEAGENKFSVFSVNNTHRNATGTWNLGVGEELASNGNPDPDLYIIFDDSEIVVQPEEWNISVGNNLVNWHQVDNEDILAMSAGKGLAIDVDQLFAKKKIMSAQYIRLTLVTTGETKERRVDAIVFPYVARPLTIAASVTIDPLSFSYDEAETVNKIVFGGSDGRLLVFQRGIFNITYYRKYRTRKAVLIEIPAIAYGIVSPGFFQNWDSYTDAYFNLGETIWSIQGTPKKPLIPSWRYIQGETKEFTGGLYTGLGLHHISRSDCSGGPGSELIITYDGGPPHIINSETGALDGTAYTPYVLEDVIPFSFGIDTFAFGDLYQGDSKDELIIFPWYSTYKKPSSYDSRLLPVIFNWITNKYQNPTTLSDVDGHLYSYLAESTTYPSAAIVDVDNDRLQDIILSNGRLALLWNIGTTTSPQFKFDFEYFRELNERAISNPIFSPNAWDYDHDGDYDIAYSYGRGSGTFRYGMDFFENHGTPIDPIWARNAYVMKNPTTDGSLRFNNYTAGVIVPSNSNESSAESIWVWNGFPTKENLRELHAETDQQNSYVIGTNPEVMKLELNLKQSPPNAINYGYAMVKSWSNLKEIKDWTITLTTSSNLDGDTDAEIIVCDYDNNVYVFEHLIENTYKRAFKTHDLNHTEITNYSPYAFQELVGVSGTFRRTIFDHGNLLTAGFDYNGNGNEEFIITAGLLVYIFEATGFNDEFKLIFEIDYRNMVIDYDITQFSALAITPDFDGRGSMIALGAGRQLFLLRWDPEIGWLESFQSISGTGFFDQPGNPIFHPTLDIQTMLFADINQDNTTELWIGGSNRSNTLITHGGVFFKGNEYKLFTESKTWGEAKAACESLGGHLVTITSQEENDFVQSLAGWRAHIGLYEPSPGNWVWITGEPYGPYTNWGGGQPSNSGGVEDYAEIMMDLNGVWNDIADYHVRQYVCEWEKEKTFVKTNTGFLLALQSDFGNVHHIYDFPSISTHVNTLGTSDSDFDGNLELIIGHGHGVDIWEAQESTSLSFTRIEIISSDPNYGNPHGLLPTFDTYQSPVGLAPHAHDVVQIDNGDFFVVYGIEEEFHDPFSGNEQLVNTTNGDGRLYYSVTLNASDVGSAKSQQLFTPPQGLLITEVFYEDIDDNPANYSYHWVELYNPNIFDVNLTNWYLQINSTLDISFGTGVIPSREYFVIAQNSSVFTDRYGFAPDYENTSLKFTVPDGSDTLSLYYNAVEIDSTPQLTPIISILERKNQSNVIQTAVIPVDTDAPADWVSNDLTTNGTPKVRNYDNSDGFVDGVEYEPTIIQLQNGNILVSWVIAYKNATDYDKCVLSRNFDRNGNPISDIRLIDRITSPADPDTQIRGLGTLQINNGTHDYIFYCYTQTNTSILQGDLTLKVIFNNVLSDNSANLGLGEYFIHSVDLIDINDRLGIVFAGYSKNTFYAAQQLYFTVLNSTYHNQGVFPITSGVGNARFPSAATMVGYSNRIAVLYERITGGKTEIVSIFSSDFGTTWSDSYVLSSDDPYLIQTPLGFTTENDTVVINRQNYRPRVTDDGTGGIIYQFVSRFLIPIGDDKYSGNIYNHEGIDHNFVTQLWVGQIERGHWFKFTDIMDVTAIAVGDSDNDMRNELFLGHDYRVSLLEVTNDNSYTQKWQYQPPSYVSLHPELINSTFAEFFVSDTAKSREVGAVSIFDGNGNGWPELIFSVRGGDVFSFEVTNLEQPINDLYAVTEEYYVSNVPDISSTTDVLLVNINGGELDLVVSDGDGISAWDIEDDRSLWNYTAPSGVEKIYFFNNSLGNPVIVGVTTTGICGLNLGGSERYWIDVAFVDTISGHLFTDVDGDLLPDLIVATTTDIRAIEPVSGDIIWENVTPDNNTQNEGYFDIATATLGSTTKISVCSGNLSIYKQINIINNNGSFLQSFNLTHLSQLDTRSRSVIGDFDGDFNLDLAIANFDNINTDKSYLEVYDLSTLDLILNVTMPIPVGLDLSRFSIYARDVNEDTIGDIILSIPTFTSSTDLFPSYGYSSAVFVIDVATETTVWHRYFTDTLTKFEIDSFGGEEVILAFTADSGLFALSLSGADVLWTDLDTQSVAADIANRENEQTLIATTCNNGTSPIFKVAGMMSKASNIITPQTYIVDTNMKVLYSNLASGEYFVFPVIVTNDGTERLLTAFTNGTLILRSFERGEIWRVQVSPFSSISAVGLEIEPFKFGLAFKTDTSDLYILERTTTQIWAQITTSGFIEASLSLDGDSDVLLLQTISGNSGTLSLLDPITKDFLWTYTSPSYFTYLKTERLDADNIGKKTHIIALDYLGTASLIELPSTSVLGGVFPAPTLGTRWITVKSIPSSDIVTKLATVVLLSDAGQLLRYTWLSNGDISELSHDITDQDEIVSLDVADQGSVTDIMIITRNNGSRVLRDDGSSMTIVNELYNFYNDSIDHHFANIDDTPESEIVIIVHNSLVIFTSEGTIVESHSLPNEIMNVIDWKVDSTMKVAFVTILRDNTIAVADPSNRILSTQNGEAAASDLKDAVVSELGQENVNTGNKTPTLELAISVFLSIFITFAFISNVRKRRQHVKKRRRSQS
ncbi:MAG: lamin tail domain-containing protein [Candidatus Heimdallarchaeota archaeon]|nr:MAG: lamin tail domain-containing protein [Candidatus Heimdallarchaeota archaeon]